MAKVIKRAETQVENVRSFLAVVVTGSKPKTRLEKLQQLFPDFSLILVQNFLARFVRRSSLSVGEFVFVSFIT